MFTCHTLGWMQLDILRTGLNISFKFDKPIEDIELARENRTTVMFPDTLQSQAVTYRHQSLSWVQKTIITSSELRSIFAMTQEEQ